MRRLVAASLISLAMVGTLAGVASADESTPASADKVIPLAQDSAPEQPAATGGTASDNSGTSSADQSAPASSAKSAGKKAATSSFGARWSSVVIGGFAGIPVAMVRHSKTEVVTATKELVDNSNKKWLLAAVSPLGITGGLVSGIAQGLVWGPLNAYKNRNEPFSAESFSLGDAK